MCLSIAVKSVSVANCNWFVFLLYSNWFLCNSTPICKATFFKNAWNNNYFYDNFLNSNGIRFKRLGDFRKVYRILSGSTFWTVLYEFIFIREIRVCRNFFPFGLQTLPPSPRIPTVCIWLKAEGTLDQCREFALCFLVRIARFLTEKSESLIRSFHSFCKERWEWIDLLGMSGKSNSILLPLLKECEER